MRILTETQGTELWEVARKGRLTASAIGKILAGKHTKGRHEYMREIVLDLEGIVDFRDSAQWYIEGRKYEKHALGWYQWEKEIDVRETGFVLHDDYNWIGCSPDGLVDPDGNIEIKYRKTTSTFAQAVSKPIPKLYDCQMQTQMWICNRKWTDYVNYWRNDQTGQEQGHIRRVYRDEAKIRELENAAFLFWQAVLEMYRERNGNVQIAYPWDVLQNLKEKGDSDEQAHARYKGTQ